MKDERVDPAGTAPEAELSAALRREADELQAGPAPVDAVVRAGRVRRGRRRAVGGAGVAALAVLAVLAGPAGLLPLSPLSGSPQSERPERSERVEPAASAPVSPSPADAGVRTVEPYAPIAVSPKTRLGLLPEGRQNYVVAEAERFREEVEYARSGKVGDSIRPKSISSGFDATDRTGIQGVDGAWRLPKPPRRIVVTVAGEDHRAELFTLPGDPGWGVYYLDTTGLPRFTSFRVTAYDADGGVFDTREVESSLPGDDSGSS